MQATSKKPSRFSFSKQDEEIKEEEVKVEDQFVTPWDFENIVASEKFRHDY